jgi:hypothetical protein
MLLVIPKRYMIYEMNSTTFAAVMEATGFALIHLVNLSNATNMCVNLPLAAFKGPTKSNPYVEKGQVISMVYSWPTCNMLLATKVLAKLTTTNQGVGIGCGHWPVKPLHVCLAHKCSCTCVASTNSRVNVSKDGAPFFHGDASH